MSKFHTKHGLRLNNAAGKVPNLSLNALIQRGPPHFILHKLKRRNKRTNVMISIAWPIWCKIISCNFCSGETKLCTFSQISSALDSRDTDYTNFTFKACPSSKHGQAHLCDLANIVKRYIWYKIFRKGRKQLIGDFPGQPMIHCFVNVL